MRALKGELALRAIPVECPRKPMEPARLLPLSIPTDACSDKYEGGVRAEYWLTFCFSIMMDVQLNLRHRRDQAFERLHGALISGALIQRRSVCPPSISSAAPVIWRA
jgi:hypothetical protein